MQSSIRWHTLHNSLIFAVWHMFQMRRESHRHITGGHLFCHSRSTAVTLFSLSPICLLICFLLRCLLTCGYSASQMLLLRALWTRWSIWWWLFVRSTALSTEVLIWRMSIARFSSEGKSAQLVHSLTARVSRKWESEFICLRVCQNSLVQLKDDESHSFFILCVCERERECNRCNLRKLAVFTYHITWHSDAHFASSQVNVVSCYRLVFYCVQGIDSLVKYEDGHQWHTFTHTVYHTVYSLTVYSHSASFTQWTVDN